jgi:hypothetical protein
MAWLGCHLAENAALQTELSTQRRAASRLRWIKNDAHTRWAARHASSALGQRLVPTLAHVRRGPSTCHAQPSAKGPATPLGSPVAVTPAASAVSQAGSTKTFDVVHLGNLCLDIIVPVDELPSEDTGALLLCGHLLHLFHHLLHGTSRRVRIFLMKHQMLRVSSGRGVRAGVRAALLAELTAQPPAEPAWEVRGVILQSVLLTLSCLPGLL